MTDPDGSSNIVNTPQTAVVARPYIALSASISSVNPSTVAVNKSGTITVTVENTGNVSAAGSLEITVTPSTDGMAVSGVTLVTAPAKKVTLKSLKAGKYTLHFKVPATLASGSYGTLAVISLDGVSTSAIGSPFATG